MAKKASGSKKRTAPPAAAAAPKRAPRKPPPAEGSVPGHNRAPGELTPDQRRALEFIHKKNIVDARKKLNDATRAHQNARKAAKAEGCRLSRIDFLILLDREGGEASLRQMMADARDAFDWRGIKVGEQTDLFPKVDRTPAVERAFEDGKRAGMEGEDCKPPHSLGVPQFNRWIDGHHEGSDLRNSILDGIKELKPSDIDEREFVAGDPPVVEAEFVEVPGHEGEPSPP